MVENSTVSPDPDKDMETVAVLLGKYVVDLSMKDRAYDANNNKNCARVELKLLNGDQTSLSVDQMCEIFDTVQRRIKALGCKNLSISFDFPDKINQVSVMRMQGDHYGDDLNVLQKVAFAIQQKRSLQNAPG